MALLLFALYWVLLLSPLAVLALAGALHGGHGLVSEIGRTMGLLGFMILMLQVFLVARFKPLTRPFGLDMVVRFHRNMALIALGMLVLHPVLMAAGEGHWELLYSLRLPWYILLGKLCLLLVVISVAMGLFQRRRSIAFEHWRLAHDLLGPAILAGVFVHSLNAGHDLHQPTLQVWWYLALAAAAVVFTWHRLARPALLARRAWAVERVRAETDEATTVELAPPAGEEPYSHLPGQFHFLTPLDAEGLPRQEHHFTISSSPERKDVRASTIKALGDFTSRVSNLRPGNRVAVHGPFGRFSHTLHPDERELVFIAGGIGITPVMSMLRHLRDTGTTTPVTLFYANPDLNQAVFRRELEDMAEQGSPKLTLVHVLKQPPEGWRGETGHISREMLMRHLAEGMDGRGFYLCGPPGLLAAARLILREMGVADNRIHAEVFRFLD
ncbi:MAG: ferric reductase-like transmembrane domain-containing protein [Deltaproteobacteria bacterium]|nr:ferric reductase-like transmembrane domain-containing protein [Deltaproteobacteria bacterium]